MRQGGFDPLLLDVWRPPTDAGSSAPAPGSIQILSVFSAAPVERDVTRIALHNRFGDELAADTRLVASPPASRAAATSSRAGETLHPSRRRNIHDAVASVTAAITAMGQRSGNKRSKPAPSR